MSIDVVSNDLESFEFDECVYQGRDGKHSTDRLCELGLQPIFHAAAGNYGLREKSITHLRPFSTNLASSNPADLVKDVVQALSDAKVGDWGPRLRIL